MQLDIFFYSTTKITAATKATPNATDAAAATAAAAATWSQQSATTTADTITDATGSGWGRVDCLTQIHMYNVCAQLLD